jgi:hypothetical protein
MFTSLQPRKQLDKILIRNSVRWAMISQYSKAKVKPLQSICSQEGIYGSKAALNFCSKLGYASFRKFYPGVAVLDSTVAIVK